MDRERLDGWLERGILFLTLAILVYAPLATGAVRDFDFLVVQLLVMAMVAVWAVRWCLHAQPRLYWPAMCWGVLAFLVYAVGRYWVADVEYVARLELTRVLVYGLFFFTVINNLHKPAHAHLIAKVVILLALFNSFYAIYQNVTGSDRVWHFVRPAVYAHRGSGSYICPNHLAGYLEMILPVALAYMLAQNSNPLRRVFFGYAAFMMLMGIGSTVSRGGLAATGLMLLLFLFWFLHQRHYRHHAWLMLVVVVLISIPLAFKVKFSVSGKQRMRLVDQLTDVRFLIWKPAWRMWKDHLWWGVGPDHFDQRYRKYRMPHRDAQTNPRRVHNDYLNVLVDWGLVGGALVGAVGVCFGTGLWRSWKSISQSEIPRAGPNRTGPVGESMVLVLGGLFGLLAILFHSLVDFNMHIPANALMAATWLALIAVQFQLASDKNWIGSGRGLKWGVGMILVLGSATLGALEIRHGSEVYWMGRAEGYTSCSEEHMASMESAFRAEPANYRTAYLLGECYRLRSWEGFEGYEDEARRAMEWFKVSSELNPYNPSSLARYGMCLDWIGQREAAGEYFQRAHMLDPAGYYITTLVGWHCMQKEEYEEAKKWFLRALQLDGGNNFMPWFYLRDAEQKLGERP